jgi:tRNA pseudouridine38-40 synthase
VVLGLSYRGQGYRGWQSQPDGRAVQDQVERALARFAGVPSLRTACAGRTDAGVHALNQVAHVDTEIDRPEFSWVRGTNRFLPADIAVQWCRLADASFHARYSAVGRRYVYVLLESPIRPSLDAGSVGWTFRPLDHVAMQAAAQHLLGEHDFSAFRSSECQAATAVKTVRSIAISKQGTYWRFEFDANAFLHHMVRNLMGSLVAVGAGLRHADWIGDVLEGRDRSRAAPTYSAAGLYFAGPYYDPAHAIPQHTAAMDWLP